MVCVAVVTPPYYIAGIQKTFNQKCQDECTFWIFGGNLTGLLFISWASAILMIEIQHYSWRKRAAALLAGARKTMA